MERWFFVNVTNNFLLARDVMQMDHLVWNAKKDHIYTQIMDKVFVDLAELTVTAINVTQMVVLHAQIAL
jgi:hypothetical protein